MDSQLQLALRQALSSFPNAKIVVAGYYQIATEATDIALFLELLPLLSLPVAGFLSLAIIHARLAYRCRLFRDTAHTAINRAILAVDPNRNNPRIQFADPGFKEENAIFGPESFIYGTERDPVHEARAQLCASVGRGLTCENASIGHPNALGARAYANAIKTVLENWR